MSFVMSIDEFKSRLFLSVLPASKMVEDYNVPCLNKGTFRLVPRLLLGEKDSAGIYETSAVVTHEMMVDVGIDMDTIFDVCMDNSKRLYPGELSEISEYLDDTEMEMAPDGIVMPQIFVLTNSVGVNGANAFFYQPELIDNLATMIGKDLLVFPAGTNEMFCIPVSNSTQISELQDMYNEAVSLLGAEDESPLAFEIMQYDHVRHNVRQMDGSIFSLTGDEESVSLARHNSR